MKKSQNRFRVQNRLTHAGLWSWERENHPPYGPNRLKRSSPSIRRQTISSRLFARETAQPENNMNKQNSDRLDLDHTISRRKFIGTTAVGSAALLTGGLASLLRAPSLLAKNGPASDESFIEATIPQLQALMASG